MVSILVPSHNGGTHLDKLVRVLGRFCPERSELVLVDDGSTDGTWEIICRLADQSCPDLTVRGLRLERKSGQQGALLAGLTSCRGKTVVTMDDDLSHPPETIAALIEKLESGADLVYARPPKRPGPPIRRLVSRLHQRHMNLLTLSSFSIDVGSYRALSDALVNRLLDRPFSWPYLSAMLLAMRPRPKTHMVCSPQWRSGQIRRFSLRNLLKLEWNLARHYNPLIRQCHRQDSTRPTVDEVCSSWIKDRTDK